jgi:hypothetical protein
MRFGEEFAIEVLAQLPLLRRLDRCFQRMTWRQKAAWYATVVVLAGPWAGSAARVKTTERNPSSRGHARRRGAAAPG